MSEYFSFVFVGLKEDVIDAVTNEQPENGFLNELRPMLLTILDLNAGNVVRFQAAGSRDPEYPSSDGFSFTFERIYGFVS